MPSLLLVAFLPHRHHPGALAVACAKRGLSLLDSCAEISVREAYADRDGLLVTVVGWLPAGREEDRVCLPMAVIEVLDEIGAALFGDAFDVMVLQPGGALTSRARVRGESLSRPLCLGCGYTVFGTAP